MHLNFFERAQVAAWAELLRGRAELVEGREGRGGF